MLDTIRGSWEEPFHLCIGMEAMEKNLRVRTSPHCWLQVVTLTTLLQKPLPGSTLSFLPWSWGVIPWTSSSYSLCDNSRFSVVLPILKPLTCTQMTQHSVLVFSPLPVVAHWIGRVLNLMASITKQNRMEENIKAAAYPMKQGHLFDETSFQTWMSVLSWMPISSSSAPGTCSPPQGPHLQPTLGSGHCWEGIYFWNALVPFYSLPLWFCHFSCLLTSTDYYFLFSSFL